MSRVLDLIHHRSLQPRPAEPAWVRALAGSTPLVFDSPHSGTLYPEDFDYACGFGELRSAEDTHVEKLFDFAPDLGVAWIEALFPRSYLDANRGEHEIDADMIEGGWPGASASDPATQAKLRLGKGLVWRCTDAGTPLYARKLQPGEVARRIERCWRPYHALVAQAVRAAQVRHGWCIHVNCHSMPAVAGSHATEHPGLVHPDFVLGDRDGSTAHPRLRSFIAEFLCARGYRVALNHPYKGVELVRRHGAPAAGRHSIQLEINRRLYMDEASFALHAGSALLRRHLRELTEALLQLDAAQLADATAGSGG